MEQFNIENLIDEFQTTFLGDEWIWRKGQREVIIEIIQTYLNKTHNVMILDCPTGSGKSIIALCASWIFNKIEKKCYILASDISLQNQYEKDLKKFNLAYGSICGVDNYDCVDNNEKHSLGTCKIRSQNAREMYCYNECPYYSARDKAAETPTSLLNYAYWLISQNYVNKHIDKPIFPPRHVTFCDEGHKVLDIVQNHYSPRIDKQFIEKLKKITHFYDTYKIKNHNSDFQTIKVDTNALFASNDQQKLLELLDEIQQHLLHIVVTGNRFKDAVKEQYPNDKPPKEWREALRLADWVKDVHCKLEDYVDIIQQTSIRNLIKNPTGEDELTFNCLEESYLMNKYFHQWNKFTVFMSATFADPNDYIKSIALKNAKYIKLDSTFDFSKSPIYFYRGRKMSYNQLEANTPWLCDKVNEILEEHKGESGIIHSASYHLALKIFKNLTIENRKRVLVYNGTEEKRQVLEQLKKKKGLVLLGPSLIEGLDLKDEWSRFQIFAKVPYLSLGDVFVATKLKINPDWYRWRAVLNILQGVGRSVRSETDWAVTYILDGSMADLIHKNRRAFPIEFIQRIKIVDE